ncbi:PEP-CTERM sorting domain-containing protein, partial [Candidatus Poribacteria bacterium]|nr:PEP-CTERM sorting domain-containing protein [Candidatus Poribacteria bacterium]
SLTALNTELELDLFATDGILGNSYVLIDNVWVQDSSGTLLGPGRLDFEDGTLQGFDDSLNTPGSVLNVAGAFPGDPGTRQLRLDEDVAFFPTLVFRDFLGSSATQLRFDFEFFTSTGSPDSFVASLLDPITLNPLLPVGARGPGDAAFLEATRSGNLLAPGVTATPIPEPSTLTLFIIGVLGMLGYGWRRRKHKV